jgi:CubicO group peptidase (beta-lactamase class C family)
MLFRSCLTIALALSPGLLKAQARPAIRSIDARVARGIDSIANAFLQDQKLPGLSIAIATTEGRLLFERGYGFADVASQRPVQSATPFRIYSISKTYASAVAHLLAQSGKLDLNAPVGRYLPELPSWRDTVTVRQLLAHTAGIPDYTDIDGYQEATNAGKSEDARFLDLALQKPLDFKPGTGWRYSNSGYELAQRIIERVAGDSLAGVLDARILRPAGLRETSPACPLDRIATGYTEAWRAGLRGDSLVVSAGRNTHRYFVASGGLCSTARDVARFFGLLAGGKVVDQSSYEDMTRPFSATVSHSGAGLFPRSDEDGLVVSHSGGGGNGNSEAVVFPQDGLALAAVTNRGGGPDLPYLLRVIRRQVLNLPQRVMADLPSPREEWLPFLGEYLDTLQQRITVVVERDGRPYAFGQRLLKQADGSFASEAYRAWNLHFRPIPGGTVELVIMSYGVEFTRGRRRP